MPMLRFHFLGPSELRWDDQPLPKPATRKSQSLLVYLVTRSDRNQPQPRERLADLFWGERPERKAHQSLTTVLWHIRRCSPKELFQANVQMPSATPVSEGWYHPSVAVLPSMTPAQPLPTTSSAQ